MLINIILIIIDIHPHSSSSSGMIALSLHAAGKRCSVLKAPWQHPWSSKLPGKGRLTSKHSKVWLFQSSQTWKDMHTITDKLFLKLFLSSRQWNQEKKHDSFEPRFGQTLKNSWIFWKQHWVSSFTSSKACLPNRNGNDMVDRMWIPYYVSEHISCNQVISCWRDGAA